MAGQWQFGMLEDDVVNRSEQQHWTTLVRRGLQQQFADRMIECNRSGQVAVQRSTSPHLIRERCECGVHKLGFGRHAITL